MTDIETLRANCTGLLPLSARVERWMEAAMCGESALSLTTLVKRFGSPLNLLNAEPMLHNISELSEVAVTRNLRFRVFFARKGNKCLTFVDAAASARAGIDVASRQELQQVLQRRITGADVICTAAIKDEQLISECVQHGVTIAVDNDDELALISGIVNHHDAAASLALRVSGFEHQGNKLHSRFGFDIEDVLSLVDSHWPRNLGSDSRIDGLHFHLDGYCPQQRVSAIRQSLHFIDELRSRGHDLKFLDIGGGIPISYLDDGKQWQDFWTTMEKSILHGGDPITYRGDGLGLQCIDGKIHGERRVYPFFQSLVRAEWLATILDSLFEEDVTIAEAIRERNLELRCEPGRSILDGCGMTIARVEFRKRHHSGAWLIGLAMNRTQCRTSSDDFLVDPIVLRQPSTSPSDGRPTAMAGFLVGAYCTESELLSLRKLNFPNGISRGDLVAFPNTAGYFMHFLESRSHQFPLAMNVAMAGEEFQLDDIDQISASHGRLEHDASVR